MQHTDIAKYIDHTLLKQTATKEQIEKLSNEAIKYKFAAVCVNPYWVTLCSKILKNTGVKTCTVVGFPLGAVPTKIKLYETDCCLQNGADEIDMVMNIGEALSGNWDFVSGEIAELAGLVHKNNKILKVIFENCLIGKEDIVKACHASMKAGADFVKTSTGFSTGGATPEDVKLMVNTVEGVCKVKAAGGVRNTEQAIQMIQIGASRIGTSAGVEIVSGKTSTGTY